MPAFDMSAFEAVQSAVTSKPRAATTVFPAPSLTSNASIDEAREQLRASTDTIIERYTSWRAGVLRGLAEMPILIESACRSESLDLLRSLSNHLADQLEGVEGDRKTYADMDGESIRGVLMIAARSRQISADTERFMRREIRRIEQMAKGRAATYEKILTRIRDARERLDSFISSQVLDSAPLREDEKSEYMQNALRRPADVEGVRERTARRLKQFPKTAAYLAR
ncbi:hypothetical protein [Methylobacterium oryzihabitans]|uniref:Uncharacterized protein n=1 Tax=Methylobacterium oryzihabitans TaxID=2499852 RepID=A0A437PI06_9HYPH|nr:hypothetical protein [Methylobacterium oryzihabitans]RVU21919.1 hypothetical protein EOE48_02420 [Methylobacterium oryzihabitans]